MIAVDQTQLKHDSVRQSAIWNLQSAIPIPNLLTCLIFVLAGANYFAAFGDLDFAWQMRTGERIVQTGTLQPLEAFSYTIGGTAVPDFEWLYEVILYWNWTLFGFGGLKLMRVLLVASTLFLLAWRLACAGVRWHGIAVTIMFASLVCVPSWNLRPLYCTTIGLLLVSGWLHDHCTGRRALTWWLPVAMLLWANSHPGVIAGQGLLLGAIAWEWLNRVVKLNSPLEMLALRRLTLIGGIGLLATFVSPGPIERLLYPFQPGLRHPIHRIFVEMMPLYSAIERTPLTVVLAYALAGAVLVTIILRFREYRLWEIALLAGLAGLANLASRSMQDWVLVMLALGVPHMVALLAGAARVDRRRRWVAFLLRADRSCHRILVSRWLRLQPGWLAAGLAAMFAVLLIPPLSWSMPIQDADDWPVAAVAHIEKLGLKGNFFSPPEFGAYLIWKLPGQARTYADTRSFFYPPIIIEDSDYLPQLCPDWRARLERVLNEYRTDYFLLETTGARGVLWQKLQPYVGEPIFLDHLSVVLSAEQIRDGVRQLSE